MTTWRWIDAKKLEVTTDSGEVFCFEGGTVKESEWRGFYDRIALDGQVFVSLRKAKIAFEVGGANYNDAYKNLRELLVELAHVSGRLSAAVKDVDAFFTPPEVTKAFKRDPEGMIDFALDFVARAYVRGDGGG